MRVTSSDRISFGRPTTVASGRYSGRSGWRLSNTYGRTKPQGSDGDGVAHSSVVPSHGLSVAGSPTIRLRTTFTMNTITLAAIVSAPSVASRFKGPQPLAASYV